LETDSDSTGMQNGTSVVIHSRLLYFTGLFMTKTDGSNRNSIVSETNSSPRPTLDCPGAHDPGGVLCSPAMSRGEILESNNQRTWSWTRQPVSDFGRYLKSLGCTSHRRTSSIAGFMPEFEPGTTGLTSPIALNAGVAGRGSSQDSSQADSRKKQQKQGKQKGSEALRSLNLNGQETELEV
jgi:hypothetical protein